MTRGRRSVLIAVTALVAVGPVACADLRRSDDPINYRPNCKYDPPLGLPAGRLVINDFDTAAAMPATDTSCFGTGSTCLSNRSATQCSSVRPNILSQNGAVFCDGNPPGKVCVQYQTVSGDASAGSYLSLTYDIAGSDNAFSGYLEKLGDTSANAWFNLREWNYRTLTLRVRAPNGGGDAELALKSADGKQSAPKVLLSEIASSIGPDWTRIEIPIEKLLSIEKTTNCVDIERLIEINIAFARVRSEIPTCGVLDVDDIAFER